MIADFELGFIEWKLLISHKLQITFLLYLMFVKYQTNIQKWYNITN